MTILAILALLNGQPDSPKKPSVADAPSAKSETTAPSASKTMCRDVLGRTVTCNPYQR